MFRQEFIDFYDLDYYLSDIENVKKIIQKLYLGDLIETINALHICITNLNINYSNDVNEIFAEYLTDEMSNLPYDDEISEFLYEYNMNDLISNNSSEYYGDVDIDINGIINDIEKLLHSDIQDYAYELTNVLPKSINSIN